MRNEREHLSGALTRACRRRSGAWPAALALVALSALTVVEPAQAFLDLDAFTARIRKSTTNSDVAKTGCVCLDSGTYRHVAGYLFRLPDRATFPTTAGQLDVLKVVCVMPGFDLTTGAGVDVESCDVFAVLPR